MIDFTHNPIIPADYTSRGRGLPYEASPLGGLFLHITLPQGAFYLFIFCFGGKKPLRNLQYRIQTGII